MIALELFAYPKLCKEALEQSLTFTKPSYLLIYLACRADWVSRDELALFFRPDADLKTARHNLRLLLTRARKFEWAAGLEQEGKRLRFELKTDVADFRDALGNADWQKATELYKRGMNVGNDQVGSLVNTLVLAYTGAALPLFLLLSLKTFLWLEPSILIW